jgi:hypothetical protein
MGRGGCNQQSSPQGTHLKLPCPELAHYTLRQIVR